MQRRNLGSVPFLMRISWVLGHLLTSSWASFPPSAAGTIPTTASHPPCGEPVRIQGHDKREVTTRRSVTVGTCKETSCEGAEVAREWMWPWPVRAGNGLHLQSQLPHHSCLPWGSPAHQTFPVGCRRNLGACPSAGELTEALELPSCSQREPSFPVFRGKSDVATLETVMT